MYFSTKTKCCSCSIHCYVSAADNSYLLAVCDRCVVILAECLHQVVSGQVFICREYAFCSLTRDTHKHRKTGTGTDEDRLKSFLIEQLVDGDGFADNDVGFDLYAERFYVLYFFCNNIKLRKTELRNTVNEYAACLMQCFKNCDIVSHLCKIACAGKTGRTRADNCNFLAILFCRSSWFDAVLSCPVSNETLQLSDGNGFALDATDTFTLALALLWADTAADCRKCTGHGNYFICFLKVAFFYFFNEIRDIDGYRTSLYAFCILAVQAAGSLFHCFLFVVSKTYLVKICCSYLRILLSYRNFL